MRSPFSGSNLSRLAAYGVRLAGCFVLLPLQFVTEASAVELLSARELASHCAALKREPESANAQYCVRYIQGFIDGAAATDVKVMLAAENSAGETFIQRAMRTRAPSLGDQYRAEHLAGFCLGQPLPMREAVAAVVADLQASSGVVMRDALARDLVYASLQRHYPCQL